MKKSKVILLVEDDELCRELEKTLFEQAGYTVLESEDAQAGIKLAEKEKPDFIVMDFQLPKMNGIEAVRILKHNSNTENIPCIIVTASATEERIEKIKSSDACGYVTKPINTRTFVEEVTQLARKAGVTNI